jgi:hypothetical protein
VAVDKLHNQPQTSPTSDGPGWWIILVGFLAGGALPLVNRTLRQQMLDGQIPFAAIIGTAVLGAAAAALLVIQAKIKSTAMRWLFLGVGIFVVAIGACIALLMIIS